MWKNRPSNYDYRSSLTENLLLEKQKEKRIKKEITLAERAVSEYEKTQIKNSSDAKKLTMLIKKSLISLSR